MSTCVYPERQNRAKAPAEWNKAAFLASWCVAVAQGSDFSCFDEQKIGPNTKMQQIKGDWIFLEIQSRFNEVGQNVMKLWLQHMCIWMHMQYSRMHLNGHQNTNHSYCTKDLVEPPHLSTAQFKQCVLFLVTGKKAAMISSRQLVQERRLKIVQLSVLHGRWNCCLFISTTYSIIQQHQVKPHIK